RAESDTAYIEAVLAFYEGRDDNARSAVERALSINPQYYNARVLTAISDLKYIDENLFHRQSCERSIVALTDAIVPVLQLGACPIHVAHLDLSIRRFLGGAAAAQPRSELYPQHHSDVCFQK